MASKFVVASKPVRGPATHAIVVGVGAYAHLIGGTGPRVRRPDGLRQLTSPPISARAVATWMIENLDDPAKPLADVALLLSEGRPATFRNPLTGRDVAVAEATIDNLEEALTEWRALGDKDESHRLILYFCGHGIARPPDVTLLASDYGVKPANVLDGSIDFRNFLLAMDSCAAREQVYFIDACRASSDTLLRAGQVNGRPIFTPDLEAEARDTLKAPVFYSTLRGARAYAREGAISPFADALLRGLAGAGADDSEGDWRVTTNRLKEALDFYLDRATKGIGKALVPATDNQAAITLTRVPGTPTGTAIVACDPVQAQRVAALSYEAGGARTARPRRSGDEWVLELPAGSYDFSADFTVAGWQPYRASAYVRPVYRRVPLKVQL